MNLIITVSVNDNLAKLIAHNPDKQQNDVITGQSIPDVLRKYADVFETNIKQSEFAAQEYAIQEIAKLSDIELLRQHSKMNRIADDSKQFYGQNEHWAALFDAIDTKLKSMINKKR